MSGNFACYPSPSTSLCLDNFRSTSPPSPHFQHKLIVASKYNIAVVVANNRELVAFRSVVDQRIEGTKSRFKVTTLDEEESDIVSIGLNADDSFLGVLVNRQQGCFVLIYAVLALSADISGEAFALSTIRIGNAISKGLAFEWNPTTSDIFAASDDEKTLSVCKLDLDNPSKYGIVGEKKLDANIHEISWSPKGKQLVVGDALGRIYQMKPELELVRMTSPPQMATGVRVVCLCWLSTTEWLVAYSDDQNSCTSTFILSIKKDKPPTWNPINLPLQSSFGVTTKLLVDWNLVLIVTPGSSQLLSLSKHPVPLRSWYLSNFNQKKYVKSSQREEGFRPLESLEPQGGTRSLWTWSVTPLISLPEPAMTDFITGIAVNLSNTEVCTIGDFSTRRLPTVVLLRSNGSLHSFWIAPPSKDYPDCYIPSVPIDISMIRHGIRPYPTGPCDSVTISVPSTMGITTVTAPSVSTSMALQPTYKPSTTPLFSTVPFGFAKVDPNSSQAKKIRSQPKVL
ncbi:hypothetical protein KIN20_021635 [Parelaphostrongylus tenuis]|uniref:Nucleoporin Nup159/Nup146 N-terminal domain-containing protein n=1 Tax=Parelaphostrongylus tenuis TaxID=148309 RepID=A0AAD5N853_PARTN|nr:hypothetical protein KIN20_021635 [Parelaphostrongylus tenuis]